MNMKHTLGPLTYFVGNADGRGLVRVEAAHDSPEAGQHVASLPRGPLAKANAAFIIRACNAHDELVAALEGAIAYIGDDSRSERRKIANMSFIESVLAKAKGE